MPHPCGRPYAQAAGESEWLQLASAPWDPGSHPGLGDDGRSSILPGYFPSASPTGWESSAVSPLWLDSCALQNDPISPAWMEMGCAEEAMNASLLCEDYRGQCVFAPVLAEYYSVPSESPEHAASSDFLPPWCRRHPWGCTAAGLRNLCCAYVVECSSPSLIPREGGGSAQPPPIYGRQAAQ